MNPFWAISALAGLLAGASWARTSDCEWLENRPQVAGTEIPLQVACAPTGLQYNWDLGDGTKTVTDGPSLKHAYTKPGQYIILVRIALPQDDTLTVVGAQTVYAPVTSSKPQNATTILFDSTNSRIWTVNPDNHSVCYIDWPSAKRSPEIKVGHKPRSLAQDAQGNIWVCNQDDATLVVLNSKSGQVMEQIKLPRASRPFAVVMDKSHGLAYVTAQASGRLIKVDVSNRKVLGDLDVTHGARGLAVSGDGKRIFVTRFISSQDAGEIVEVDGSTFTVARRMPLAYDHSPDTDVSGAGVPNAVNAVVITPDGTSAWFTAKKDNVGRGMYRNGVAMAEENAVRTFFGTLDLSANQENLSRRIDLDNKNMAKAITFTSKGTYAFVATEGTNTIDIFNVPGFLRSGSIDPRHAPSELTPQGLVVHPNDSLLFVQYFTSREVGVYDITAAGGTNNFPRVALIKTVDEDSLGAQAVLGQQVFYNSADIHMTRSGYLSCSSCHMDGASDERVWDFTDRGEGLRNTTTLLGKAGTGSGPLHWSANFDEVQDFEHDMRGPMAGTGFLPNGIFQEGTRNTTLGDAKAGKSVDLDALAAFVTSLAKVPASPFRSEDGKLTADAEAGRALFSRVDVGCVKCHSGAGFTDSKLHPSDDLSAYPPFHVVIAQPGGFLLHDVGTLKPSSGHRLHDSLPGLDTPPLKGLWASAPYLHDGSAATLMDVIDSLNPNDKHGKTSQLSHIEKEKLVAYLLQIDDGDPVAGLGVRPLAHEPRVGQGLAWIETSGGIEFHVPGNLPPELWLYRPAGNLIAHFSLASRGKKSQQGWIMHWYGKDAEGRKISPGIYLAQSRSGRETNATRFLWKSQGR